MKPWNAFFFCLALIAGLFFLAAQNHFSCHQECQPDCTGQICGDDGCGGVCGECPDDAFCSAGRCYSGLSCEDIAQPAEIPAEPLTPNVAAGRIETTRRDGFNDVYLYDDKDYLKIGVRQDWGASIIFFGQHNGQPGQNSTNTIDANDTGREVQVAFYDPARMLQGCAWNASCLTNPETACPGSIRYLGWDPVQGGNRCNIGSGIEWLQTDNGAITAGVVPRFWNPDWDQPDCSGDGCDDRDKQDRPSDVFYTQRLRFIRSHIVELQMELENIGDIDHAKTFQEFPTLYAVYGANGTQNLHVVLDSTGQQIPIDQPANDGFYMKNYESPGGWTSLQNDARDYGVGLYYENRLTSYQGWQKDGVFNNTRANFAFAIPAHAKIVARAYLMIGSFATIASLANTLDKGLPPFGVLDSPAADAVVSGTLNISGWVLDNKQVTALHLLIDGQVRGDLPLNQDRPDVASQYPGYPQGSQVGFNSQLPLDTFAACPHLITIEAIDGDGNTRIIAQRRFYVQQNR